MRIHWSQTVDLNWFFKLISLNLLSCLFNLFAWSDCLISIFFQCWLESFYCALIRFFRLCLDELHKCLSSSATSFQGFNIPSPSHVLALALASVRKRLYSPTSRRKNSGGELCTFSPLDSVGMGGGSSWNGSRLTWCASGGVVASGGMVGACRLVVVVVVV